jgi:hypothetical protein
MSSLSRRGAWLSKLIRACGALVLVAALAACGGNVNTVPIGQLGVSSTRLTFTSTAQTQSVTVSDPGYTGVFTVSGCSGIATTAIAGSVLSVTSVAANATPCTLTVSDSTSHSVTISVSVSTLSLPIE